METEAKFVVPDAATCARLQAATTFGAYVRGPVRTQQVIDQYLDTPDHRFYAHAFAARLRQRNGALLATLKSFGAPPEGAVHARQEFEVAVPGPDITTWPEGEARRLAEEIAGDRPLGRLVDVVQERHVAPLQQGERVVAELSIDTVTLANGSRAEPVYELEVELAPDGTAEDLAALSAVFADEYGLQPQPLSKFERALAAAAPPAKKDAGVLPTDSLATAVRKVARLQAAALEANEAGAREGTDPEAVHDMRVATRRLRAALRIGGTGLGGKRVRAVRQGSRRLAGVLGEARDLDVLLAGAATFRATLPAELQPDVAALELAWTARRKRAGRRLHALLDSRRYRRFERALGKLVAEAPDLPADRAAPVPYQVRHVIGSLIWARYEAVRAYEVVMDAPPIPALHALRIDGKYLRYCLEFFREVLPEDAAALTADVVGLQDTLGLLHDATVAADAGRAFADGRPTAPGEVPPGLAAYIADREAAVPALAAEAQTRFSAIAGPAWRTRLATALAAV